MHLPTGNPGDLNDKNNVLYSVHQRGKQKTLWYKSSWESMTDQNVPTNPEHVTYRSKIFPYHSLHRSMMSTITPEIKAKEGYEIRFCDDLFINLIREYRLYFNDVELQFGNDKLLNFELKLRKDWETISQEVGNRESLTSWTDHLRKEFISLYIPWCYASDKSDAFPLNLCGHNDRLEHIIEFKLKLSELLLIRNSDGETVEFDESLIEVSGNMDSIPIPEMEGLYTTLTTKECDYVSCRKDETNGQKEYFTRSVYYIEDENETVLGKKVNLKVDSKFTLPVDTVYWGAQNLTDSETEKSIVLHYTHDTFDHSPVKSTRIESSIGVVLDNKSSYKTERGYSLSQFTNTPSTPGFNLWKNSVLMKDDPRKFVPGVNLSSGSVTVTLDDKNKTSNKYLVFSLLSHTKKFVFTSYPKTQEERLHASATIMQVEDN
tara:strand:+ start:448 stop:1743 length:1296 start_codon:yes stop_codon:yes gene_type:complete